jgi:hypothetical protein
MRKIPELLFLVAICAIGLLGCWRLPENFSSLPLEDKVQAYARRFRLGGARDSRAEDLIAAHGYAAAEAMVPYIKRAKGEIPPFAAINIVWDVQLRGCDLRGSAASIALQELLRSGHPRVDEQHAAEAALEAIASVLHSAPVAEQLSVEACKP